MCGVVELVKNALYTTIECPDGIITKRNIVVRVVGFGVTATGQVRLKGWIELFVANYAGAKNSFATWSSRPGYFNLSLSQNRT
jgi:hypothetical protein